MKKIIVLATFSLLLTNLIAQDSSVVKLKSKKGEAFLPEANDWAIGFNAVPFLNYVGNLFSGATNSNSSPNASWVNPGTMTVTGKLFKDAKTAYRVTARVGFNSKSLVALIPSATTVVATYPTPKNMREDKWTSGNSFFGLGGGIEKRRGNTRLQGFYGAEGLIWIAGSKNKFSYGNDLSASVNVINSSTNFGANATPNGSNITTDPSYGIPARVIADKVGTTFGIGVRGFIGAEYFVFPKIAIGAEYGWGIGFSRTGKGSRKIESVSGSSVATIEYETNKSGSFGIDTDINGGTGSGTAQLKVTFHF
jgi:hypothetical protein